MIVLGVDPGYRNLGLTLVRISADQTAAKVVFSQNMSVGKATAPMAFTKFLWPELERLTRTALSTPWPARRPLSLWGKSRLRPFYGLSLLS